MGNCKSATATNYPGNARVAKPTYQPSNEEYKQVNSTTAVANAHFVTCPGGNALKLVGKPNRAETTTMMMTGGVGGSVGEGGGFARYISVTLPPGVTSGDIIHPTCLAKYLLHTSKLMIFYDHIILQYMPK
eukprot:CAMPEP_0201653648 /NCGR_PEP_ID=MMETSP0493-20130528/45093_1 /ASSEMBLY_ACC=CAM_ASM_000838 /TAXON_ID=420259 /ORGANISM="Thalassiosira gravida, Strain GMp14c1" /LENGTH=130 /DNA_ID=CAMNT_0048130185 /DNA_START=29 /DNA_END=421 /DNA_ORIENTATION=-